MFNLGFLRSDSTRRFFRHLLVRTGEALVALSAWQELGANPRLPHDFHLLEFYRQLEVLGHSTERIDHPILTRFLTFCEPDQDHAHDWYRGVAARVQVALVVSRPDDPYASIKLDVEKILARGVLDFVMNEVYHYGLPHDVERNRTAFSFDPSFPDRAPLPGLAPPVSGKAYEDSTPPPSLTATAEVMLTNPAAYGIIEANPNEDGMLHLPYVWDEQISRDVVMSDRDVASHHRKSMRQRKLLRTSTVRKSVRSAAVLANERIELIKEEEMMKALGLDLVLTGGDGDGGGGGSGNGDGGGAGGDPFASPGLGSPRSSRPPLNTLLLQRKLDVPHHIYSNAHMTRLPGKNSHDDAARHLRPGTRYSPPPRPVKRRRLTLSSLTSSTSPSSVSVPTPIKREPGVSLSTSSIHVVHPHPSPGPSQGSSPGPGSHPGPRRQLYVRTTTMHADHDQEGTTTQAHDHFYQIGIPTPPRKGRGKTAPPHSRRRSGRDGLRPSRRTTPPVAPTAGAEPSLLFGRPDVKLSRSPVVKILPKVLEGGGVVTREGDAPRDPLSPITALALQMPSEGKGDLALEGAMIDTFGFGQELSPLPVPLPLPGSEVDAFHFLDSLRKGDQEGERYGGRDQDRDAGKDEEHWNRSNGEMSDYDIGEESFPELWKDVDTLEDMGDWEPGEEMEMELALGMETGMGMGHQEGSGLLPLRLKGLRSPESDVTDITAEWDVEPHASCPRTFLRYHVWGWPAPPGVTWTESPPSPTSLPTRGWAHAQKSEKKRKANE
jgi:hypothetical protein